MASNARVSEFWGAIRSIRFTLQRTPPFPAGSRMSGMAQENREREGFYVWLGEMLRPPLGIPGMSVQHSPTANERLADSCPRAGSSMRKTHGFPSIPPTHVDRTCIVQEILKLYQAPTVGTTLVTPDTIYYLFPSQAHNLA